MNNNINNNTAHRQDEQRRKMALLPALAGTVTFTGVGSIALLGSFYFIHSDSLFTWFNSIGITSATLALISYLTYLDKKYSVSSCGW
jgi:hypothetical protein